MTMEEELIHKDEDLEINLGDVEVEWEGILPSSFFPENSFTTSESMAIDNGREVTGRSIGYNVLCNRLEAFWLCSQFLCDISRE